MHPASASPECSWWGPASCHHTTEHMTKLKSEMDVPTTAESWARFKPSRILGLLDYGKSLLMAP